MNYRLEVIQRALEVYMESKRHVFPRFYFISNCELLEILGNSKNSESIQPHLKKLFTNVYSIKTIVSYHSKLFLLLILSPATMAISVCSWLRLVQNTCMYGKDLSLKPGGHPSGN